MNKLLQITVFGLVFVAACCSHADAMNVQIRDGRLVVDGVYVNGHGPYRFLVDTGCTRNHIGLPLAESIGLRATFNALLESPAGVISAPGAEGIEVTLGSIRADKQTFLFAGLDTVHQSWPDIQGILGESFLSQFDYLIDIRGKRLEFGGRRSDGKGTRVSYKTVDGRPVVSTNLGRLVLDSGSLWVIRYDVKAPEAPFGIATLSGSARVGYVACSVTIAGHLFWSGAAIAFPYADDPGVDGLLPASLFKSVYVSNSEGYIIFE